jgi:hypothetical protein
VAASPGLQQAICELIWITMKRFLCTVSILTLCLGAVAAGKKDKHPLMGSSSVVWAGLDYSMVHMVGPGDFNNPDNIFPHAFESWNSLYLRERIRFLEKEMKKQVVLDVAGVAERNKQATAKQIIAAPGPDDSVEKSHITDKDIADAVKSYKLESKEGLGLVFIVDRLVKPTQRGAVYLVFFDVSKREVIASKRVIAPAVGFGFRNYWFGVIKKAESELGKMR